MNKVPKMISTKDLSYLSDMLDWNLVYAKTAKHFSDESDNDEIKNFLQAVHNMHKEHYEFLLNLLK